MKVLGKQSGQRFAKNPRFQADVRMMRYGVECSVYNVFGDTPHQLLQHFPSLNNFKPEIEYRW